tara:strand:+ start:4090 stop:4674 length:585 start_codon:yes stop_codon:yes gene_type:complete
LKIIELYKVIFCSESKKYKIIFRTLENDKEFILFFESHYAKNIAMASENIASISLSQYELFINLLNDLKMKVDKVLLKEKNNILSCVINISNHNKSVNEIYSFVGDAIIIALKTFSNIYIDENFLVDLNDNNLIKKKYFKDDTAEEELKKNILHENNSIKSKVDILESALAESISSENYEAAAFIRDRIKQLRQ